MLGEVWPGVRHDFKYNLIYANVLSFRFPIMQVSPMFGGVWPSLWHNYRYNLIYAHLLSSRSSIMRVSSLFGGVWPSLWQRRLFLQQRMQTQTRKLQAKERSLRQTQGTLQWVHPSHLSRLIFRWRMCVWAMPDKHLGCGAMGPGPWASRLGGPRACRLHH